MPSGVFLIIFFVAVVCDDLDTPIPVTNGLVLDLRGDIGVSNSKWRKQVSGGPDADVPSAVRYSEAEKAFEFPGQGEIITVPIYTNPTKMKAVTYVAWVKLVDAMNTLGWILSQAPDYGWSRAITIRDPRMGGVGVTPGKYNSGLGNMGSGQWNHVVGVWSGTDNNCSIYRNSIKYSHTCSNGHGNITSEVLAIGGRGRNDQRHNPKVWMTDVAVFNRTLTNTEVQSLYMHGRPSQQAMTKLVSPMAYWDWGNCGPQGNDHNWDWCGRMAFNCEPEVSTSQCPNGVAYLLSTSGDGTCCNSVVIDGCSYAYVARYSCTAQAMTNLVSPMAYWDAGNCGPQGNDHNWEWCGRMAFNCEPEVSTSQCPNGVAYLLSTSGDGTCCNSVVIDGCSYAYIAQYSCTAQAMTTLVSPVAYWDSGNCGPQGNDHNWDWCGRAAFACQPEVSTSQCPNGVAYLVSTSGDGTCCNSVVIDGCSYAYFSQYSCTAHETGTTVVGTFSPGKAQDDDGSIMAIVIVALVSFVVFLILVAIIIYLWCRVRKVETNLQCISGQFTTIGVVGMPVSSEGMVLGNDKNMA